MKRCIAITILLIALNAYSQNIPNKANTIVIKGLSFTDVVNGLLDKGYSFEKLDSNLNTLKTEYQNGSGKTKGYKLHYYVRVKDSTASIWGEWYSPDQIGTNPFGREGTAENSSHRIENIAAHRNPFNEMNGLALSFRKPVQYLIK